MKRSIYILPVLFGVLLLLGACSGYRYHTTKVLNEDFTQYKTYGWLQPVDSMSKSYFNNDIARTNIMETANRELEARGLTYTKDDPDILFRYIAIVNNKSRDVYSSPYMHSPWGWRYGYYNPWMWHGAWGPYSVPVGRERFRAGHIIIEARDTDSNMVLWQARGSVEVRNPEQAINNLPEMVTGILAQYPVKALKR